MTEFKKGDVCWSITYSNNPLLSDPHIVHVKIKEKYLMDGDRMVNAEVINSWETVDLFAEDLFKTKLDAVMALEKIRDED